MCLAAFKERVATATSDHSRLAGPISPNASSITLGYRRGVGLAKKGVWAARSGIGSRHRSAFGRYALPHTVLDQLRLIEAKHTAFTNRLASIDTFEPLAREGYAKRLPR